MKFLPMQLYILTLRTRPSLEFNTSSFLFCICVNWGDILGNPFWGSFSRNIIRAKWPHRVIVPGRPHGFSSPVNRRHKRVKYLQRDHQAQWQTNTSHPGMPLHPWELVNVIFSLTAMKVTALKWKCRKPFNKITIVFMILSTKVAGIFL